MKTRFFVFVLIATFFVPVFGQTYQEYEKNHALGETFEQYAIRVKRAEYAAAFEEEYAKRKAPYKVYPVKEPAAVDLGLPSGVLWGAFNLGATKPEDGGNRYAWGETKAKGKFFLSNYQYGSPQKVTTTGGGKDANGFEIPVKEVYTPETWTDLGDDIAGTKYDAAREALGDKWRMPSFEDFKELALYCKFEEITKNNVKGIKVTGRNGKWIFLPDVECQYHDLKFDTGTLYWTSTALPEKSNASTFAEIDKIGLYKSGQVSVMYMRRDAGFAIRPVYVDLAKIAEDNLKEEENKKKAVSDLISDVENLISLYEVDITRKYSNQYDISVVNKCIEKMKTVSSEYYSKDWYALKDRLNGLSLVFDYKYFDKPLTVDQRDNIIIKSAKQISGYDGKSPSGDRNFLQILKNLKKIALDKKEMSETRFFLFNALVLESKMNGVPSDSYVNDLFELCRYCQDLKKDALSTWAPDLQELVEWAEPSNTAVQNRDLYTILATLYEKGGEKKAAKKIRSEKLGLK